MNLNQKKLFIFGTKLNFYMHHNCTPQIIRPDVKSSNILLDSEFHAKIADFGLAKMLAKQGEPHTMSAVAGSFGYFALGKKHSQTDNFCSFDNTNCSIRINIILLFHCRVCSHNKSERKDWYLQLYQNFKFVRQRGLSLFFEVVKKCWDNEGC